MYLIVFIMFMKFLEKKTLKLVQDFFHANPLLVGEKNFW